jgi:hypothetical protein
MQELRPTLKGVDDVHAYGREYSVVWCYIYQTEGERNHPLMRALRLLERSDISSCVMLLQLDENRWIDQEISGRRKTPVIVPFSGGFPLCLCSSVGELEQRASEVLDFAGQVREATNKRRTLKASENTNAGGSL